MSMVIDDDARNGITEQWSRVELELVETLA